MPIRKLDVEAWRDAILVATGELDRSLGGEPHELSDVAHRRRTIYGLVKRRELADILRLHDFPDPVAHSATRVPTTTPLQQLFVLNSSLMQVRAEALACRVRGASADDLPRQVRLAHQLLFQRDVTEDELAVAVQFLRSSQADGTPPDTAWRLYAQALLASNEFQFVD